MKKRNIRILRRLIDKIIFDELSLKKIIKLSLTKKNKHGEKQKN